MPADTLLDPVDRGWQALTRGAIPVALTAVQPHLEGTDAGPWLIAALCAERVGDHEALTHLLAGVRERALAPRWRSELEALERRARFYLGSLASPGSALEALVARLPSSATTLPELDVALAFAGNLARRGDWSALDALTSRRAAALNAELPARVRAQVERQLGRWPLSDQPDPVFVGGCTGSGLDSAMALFSGHPALHAPQTSGIVHQLARLRQDWQNEDPRRIDRACRAFLQALHADEPGRIVEQSPGALLHLSWLGTLLPRARFVHVVRDGHAVAASLHADQDWFTGDLREAARYWSMVVDAVHEQAAHCADRVLELRYEELLADPDAARARVLAFLAEAPPQDGAWVPVDPAPVLTECERAIVEHEAGATLHRLGYAG